MVILEKGNQKHKKEKNLEKLNFCSSPSQGSRQPPKPPPEIFSFFLFSGRLANSHNPESHTAYPHNRKQQHPIFFVFEFFSPKNNRTPASSSPPSSPQPVLSQQPLTLLSLLVLIGDPACSRSPSALPAFS